MFTVFKEGKLSLSSYSEEKCKVCEVILVQMFNQQRMYKFVLRISYKSASKFINKALKRALNTGVIVHLITCLCLLSNFKCRS